MIKHEDGSTTEKTVIQDKDADVTVTVTVKKDAAGEILSAKASMSVTAENKKTATISADLVEQIQETAGNGQTDLTISVKDAKGNLCYKLKLDAEDLTADKELYIYKLNKKTGEYTMVNAKKYMVKEDGLSISVARKATYVLLDKTEAAKINKKILATVKPADKKITISKGERAAFDLAQALNMQNVKKITYATTKKNVVVISKSGEMTAKQKGIVVIQAEVTLKNGTRKTITMTVIVE